MAALNPQHRAAGWIATFAAGLRAAVPAWEADSLLRAPLPTTDSLAVADSLSRGAAGLALDLLLILAGALLLALLFHRRSS
ncbi:MAG: hypothetical protein WC326_09155 [Candidatus Delongbacteria bacterium]